MRPGVHPPVTDSAVSIANLWNNVNRNISDISQIFFGTCLTILSENSAIVFASTNLEGNMKKISGNFWKVWSQTNALYTEWCAERNYNPYRLLVLYAVNSHEPITQKQIADRTGLSKQTVATVMRGLKEEDYVTLSAGTEDRREKYVRLTEKGSACATEMLAPLYALESRVFNAMGGERIRQMMDAVSLFNTVFEKEMKVSRDETKQK